MKKELKLKLPVGTKILSVSVSNRVLSVFTLSPLVEEFEDRVIHSYKTGSETGRSALLRFISTAIDGVNEYHIFEYLGK